MRNRTLRVLLSCLVGILLITTYMVLICMDALVGPMLIKEIISSACVGMCIGKVMWTIERKLTTKAYEKIKKEIEKLMEDKYE